MHFEKIGTHKIKISRAKAILPTQDMLKGISDA
jgi:hypothetical protein